MATEYVIWNVSNIKIKYHKRFLHFKSKNAVRDPALLWPGGIVYYTIDTGFSKSFTMYIAKTILLGVYLFLPFILIRLFIFIFTAAEELATLADAFAQYEANSCIRFIVRNKEKDYVIVQKTGGG